ncbi:NADH dehydrogenase, FAD-containing subunit [Moritella sp. PE36]|uniref:NAD(P)/FAD-dependent oxidoreductase n=1 Tax=Moritella sp. PE36 TaxID=58051 RepID=UPI00015686D7|nr:FAD-dependent oxidoreductase [Moritella sp. PE36]EDM68769.1 NADH dehydrogenase, FAD-containing subunit [Moritella sp. PE36]
MQIPHIVIIGGGAGGLLLATKLGRKQGKQNQAKITLIDSSGHHIWKPLLHKLVGGGLNQPADKLDYRRHGNTNGYQFLHASLDSINRQGKNLSYQIIDDDNKALERLNYDYLVIAIGSQANDFGTPGAAEHCQFLDCTHQAQQLRNSLQQALTDTTSADTLNVNIVGAGATGVELAAELTKMGKQYSCQLSVNLLEASERILPALSQDIAQLSTHSLTNIGVNVIVNTRVNAVQSNGLTTAEGQHYPATFNIWSAGIIAPKLLRTLDGLETDNNNRLHVNSNLSTTLDRNVFAIGDCCACLQTNGKTVPARAQAARQMADYLAITLFEIQAGKTTKPFVFDDKGSIISISRFNAFGILKKGPILRGRIARYTYNALYRTHQKALFGLYSTGLIILADWLRSRIKNSPTKLL